MDRQSESGRLFFPVALFVLRGVSDRILTPVFRATGLLGELSDAVSALVRKPAAGLAFPAKKSHKNNAGSDSRFDFPSLQSLARF